MNEVRILIQLCYLLISVATFFHFRRSILLILSGGCLERRRTSLLLENYLLFCQAKKKKACQVGKTYHNITLLRYFYFIWSFFSSLFLALLRMNECSPNKLLKGILFYYHPQNVKSVFFFSSVVTYFVSVFTGKDPGSETEALVYINMYGDFGDSGHRELRKSNRPKMFAKGQVRRVLKSTVPLYFTPRLCLIL